MQIVTLIYIQKQLDLDQGLKLQLAKILLNSDTESEEVISSSTESDHSCSCSHMKVVAQMHQLNVLTSDQKDLLRQIDQEVDPLRQKYLLEQYLETPTKSQGLKPYSLREIITRHEEKQQKQPGTISHLQGEIKMIKSELKELKQLYHKLENKLCDNWTPTGFNVPTKRN